jgi:hypothetical protein
MKLFVLDGFLYRSYGIKWTPESVLKKITEKTGTLFLPGTAFLG